MIGNAVLQVAKSLQVDESNNGLSRLPSVLPGNLRILLERNSEERWKGQAGDKEESRAK